MKCWIKWAVVGLCLCLCLVGCSGKTEPGPRGSEADPEFPEYDHEVIELLGPKDDDVRVDIKVAGQEETDPRLDYTKIVLALIKQVSNDLDSVGCSAALKEQIRANPGVIGEQHEKHNYFVYSIGQIADSTEVSCNVGYYDNGNMVVELIQFENSEGLITIKEIDKLLVFLSGGAYVL